MLLGELLARFDDETVASETILRLGDLSLVAALRARADAEGVTLGAYAAGTVRRFWTRSRRVAPVVWHGRKAGSHSRPTGGV